jgi:hypothetical protein
MLALRAACWVWVAVIMAIVVLSAADFGGLGWRSPVVQGIAFAAGAVLFAVADRDRPHLLRRREGAESPLGYLVTRFKRHLLRIAAMLIGYAILLEVGRWLAVGPRFRLAQLAANIGWILFACAMLYTLTRVFLVNRDLDGITRRHLAGTAAALRSEMAYSAYLRDISQAAYAVCTNTAIAADDKVDRVRRMLDKALAAQLPNYDEDLLDTVFGARKASPAPYRPEPDHNPSWVEGEESG